MFRRSFLAAGLATPALATPALAQARFPSRPIRFLIPWPPGGSLDALHRRMFEVVQQDLGQGVVNYKAILKQARKSGMKHFLVEQEQYPESPMASMQANAQYMNGLRI